MTVFVYITLFSKLINVTKVTGYECSNQYKVNTFHYINYQDYVCTSSRSFFRERPFKLEGGLKYSDSQCC